MNNSADVNLSSVLEFVAMQRQHSQKNDHSLSHLESVIRITNIPIVETGWKYAGNVYSKIKNSNSLTNWTLSTAENSINMAVEEILPSAVSYLHTPIHIMDRIVCKSLDIVEQRVPSVYLPPQVMIWQTKEYMTDKLVKPVLKRADSVVEIGNAVLASKYTTIAAHTLDSALNVADKYVDKYLPDAADQAFEGHGLLEQNGNITTYQILDVTVHPSTSTEDEETETAKTPPAEGPTGQAINTFHHADRFSRKLQRRLTKRTIAEAKAIRERSAESMHVLLYVAELVATDPKLAVTKAKDLWTHLSQDEPENQARPETLEQLVVMLTRESARRLVHLINFTRTTVSKLPHTITIGVHLTTSQVYKLFDRISKTIRFESLRNGTAGSKKRARKMSTIIQQINLLTTLFLERLALAVAGQPKVIVSRKNSKSSKHRNNHHHNNQIATRRTGMQHRHSNNNTNHTT